MDRKVAQLDGQLLESEFDNFAEREQLQRPARPYGGTSHTRLWPIVPIDRGATPSHGLAENARRLPGRPVILIYLNVRAVSWRGSPRCAVQCSLWQRALVLSCFTPARPQLLFSFTELQKVSSARLRQ